VPGMDAAVVRRDVALPGAPKIDVYTPAAPRAGQLPVVVFANGVGDVPGSQLRSWQVYQDWARAVAARGYAAVLHVADGTRAQDDIASVLEGLRTGGAALGLDGDRVIVWACSGNVTAALPVLMERAPRGVRAAVIYYGAGPAKQLRKDLPILWVLAGQENPQLIRGQRALWARAVEEGAPWTMVQAPTLPHAFDGLDTSEDSRRIVAATLAFFDAHLGALPAAPPASEGRGILADLYGQRPLAAVPKLEALARAHPRNPEALATLAWAYRNAGKNRDAVAAYAKAFALDPTDLLVARHLATIASQVGDCRAAAPAFAALARTTLDAQLLTAQGTCDLLEGRARGGPAAHRRGDRGRSQGERHVLQRRLRARARRQA
jgi:dienelactone hydrolase